MSRPFWRVKQRSVAAISPHVWKLPLLVNLWLAVTAAALTTAVHKRTQYETSLVPFTAAVLVVLLCPLNLVWLKLAAHYHKPSNATSQQSRPPPLDGGSRGPPKQKSRTVMVLRVCSSEKRSSPHCKVVRTVVCILVILGVLFLLLLLAGDVERNPGPTVVTLDMVQEIAALITEEAGEWNLLLGQLKVSVGKLEQLRAENAGRPNAAQRCLIAGLRHWVVSDENPTYEKIVAILRGLVLTNERLAVEVEEFAQRVGSASGEAKVETMSSSSLRERSPPAEEAAIRGEVPQSAESPPANPAAQAFQTVFPQLVRTVHDPAGLAHELFAKGFISNDMLWPMSTLGVSIRDRSRKLLMTLHARLETNPSDFEAIAGVLETSTALSSGPASLLRYAFLHPGSPQGSRHGTSQASHTTQRLPDKKLLLEALEKSKKEWKTIGNILCVPSSELNEIESSFSTTEERLGEVVKYWERLEQLNPRRRIAGALHRIAEDADLELTFELEPLEDSSLSLENVLSLVKKTKKNWWYLMGWLDVPYFYCEKIRRDYHTIDEQKEEAVKYWLSTVADASWSTLAGALYRFEEEEALEALKEVPQASLDNRTPVHVQNLRILLGGLTEWEELGKLLDMPDSELKTVDSSVKMLEKWHTNHPAPSWKVVERALIKRKKTEEHKVLKNLKYYAEATQDAGTQCIPEVHHKSLQTESHFSQSFLRGVDVVARTEFTYTGAVESFEWKGHGFRLHFPENILPKGVSACVVDIKAAISGQFEFPEDTELVSGVYCIYSPHKFTQPVTAEVQHCALIDKREDTSELSFVRAKCSQPELPYRFEVLDHHKAVFSEHSSFGSVQLTHFSMVGAVKRKRHLRTNYCSQLYYRELPYAIDVDFVIIKNLSVIIKAVEDKFLKCGAVAGPDQKVVFAARVIKMDISKEGVPVGNGGKITPLTHPGISRDEVDSYSCRGTRGRVPSCRLHIKRHSGTDVELFSAELIGAKEPNNYCVIECSPARPGAEGTGNTEHCDEILDGKLTLSHILSFNWKNEGNVETFKVLEKFAVKWKNLGIKLGFDRQKLSTIQRNNRTEEECFQDVMEVWLTDKSYTNYAVTWRGLMQALRDCNDVGRIVDELELALKHQVS